MMNSLFDYQSLSFSNIFVWYRLRRSKDLFYVVVVVAREIFRLESKTIKWEFRGETSKRTAQRRAD